ncbi:hypothetical protein ACFX1X_024959 [Malus domestica]
MDVHNRRVRRDLPLDSSAFRWSLLVCGPATSFAGVMFPWNFSRVYIDSKAREKAFAEGEVDFCILRAIAIEHPFDADATVLDVLSEFPNLATVIFCCQSCAGSESWDSTGTSRVPNRLTMLQKTLFSAMESVINMMREVEVQEKAVDIVQEEASRGGLDIMVKVEELKRMLAHAKDANDIVHAREVFGKKAILATEARELQSRLLNLSDERDKSLAILNEGESATVKAQSKRISNGFSRKCAALVKEQRARIYILRRCATMLLCWYIQGDD